MKKFKVLIIRFRRVGDAVLSSSLCTTLKKSNPDVEIHYVIDQNIEILFENHADIDRVITFTKEEKKDFFIYIKKVWQLMRTEKYDAIIDARSTVNSLCFTLFSLRSRYRIGFRKIYTRPIFNYQIANKDNLYYVDSIQQLLTPLNKEFKIVNSSIFRLCLSDDEKFRAREYMKNKGLDFSKPIIFCAVATRLVYKRWDLNRMKDVLEFLIQKYDAQLIFNFSGDEEAEYAKGLYSEMNRDPHIFIDIQANNLRQMALIISNCHCFFGNEGGPRHIAQALSVPSFAIFPPSVPMHIWLPKANADHIGIQPVDINKYIASDPSASYKEKFDLITAEEVKRRLEEFLNNHLTCK
jgi:heptosyltransferase-2